MSGRYERLVYHVDSGEVKDLAKALKKEGRKPWKSREFPCEPLHPQRRAGYTEAGFWSLHCVRQGSWFRTSPLADKAIFVVEEPIAGFSPVARIFETDFRPPRLPTGEELEALLREAAYLGRRPEEWEQIEKVDAKSREEVREKVYAILGKGPAPRESFPQVFDRQCANHANHLACRFCIEEDGRRVPYSVTDSAHTCSSCMEMFGVIGTEHPVKYVTLCPGPVLECGLPPDVYYRVELL